MKSQFEFEDFVYPHQEDAIKTIVNERKRFGLAKEWVAEYAGFSITQYRRIETGERKLTLVDFMRIWWVLSNYSKSLDSPFRRVVRIVEDFIDWHITSFDIFINECFPQVSRLLDLVDNCRLAKIVFVSIIVGTKLLFLAEINGLSILPFPFVSNDH